MSNEEQDILATSFESSVINSALNRIDGPEPDVEREWEALERRLHRGRRVWAVAWRVAAMAAACGLLIVMMRTTRHDATTVSDMPALSETAVEPARIYTPDTDGRVVEVGSDDAAQQGVAQQLPNELVELKTPVGEDLHATLSDGTKVWLNSGSTMRLYKYFSDKERRVRLSGEAYFEVRHNADRPFIVETDYFTVNDLGTSFNVKAYSKSEAAVALVDGKVAVQTAGDPVELKPGQVAAVKNGAIAVSAVDTYPLTQRKDGLFYFNEATLKDVMTEIARWYGRSVAFENGENINMRIHFVDERSLSLKDIVNDLNNIDGVQVFLGADDIIVR